MQIIIEKVKDPNQVQFRSDAGSVAAHWDGSTPVEGEDYEVDIELPGVLEWGTAIAPTDQPPGQLFEENGQICLSGRLLHVGDDQECEIMFRDDILLLDVSGEQPAGLTVPGNVMVRLPAIKIFEMNL